MEFELCLLDLILTLNLMPQLFVNPPLMLIMFPSQDNEDKEPEDTIHFLKGFN